MIKKSVVGVSVSPDAGLEVAQIDFATGTVEKYGKKSVEFSIIKREIADLDIFKETLQDLLTEMDIPKGTEIVLNMPTVAYKVSDFPAALERSQLESAIEEDLYENPYLKNYEPCFSYSILSSTLQFNKVGYNALQKSTIIELILSIREMGYKVKAIDTSATSTLRSLIYLDRVNTEPDTNWVLLAIENGCCRIMSMIGRQCVDVFEENVSIGEVLTDAENYSTVISAVEPLLKNLPSKYLCVVSKTNIISAEVIANKITYSAPIIYQEANCYTKEPLLNMSGMVDSEYTKSISLDVIGAAIYMDFDKVSTGNFNLYNKTLGDIYLMEMPPELFNGKIVLSNSFLIVIGTIIIGFLVLLVIFMMSWFAMQNASMDKDIATMNKEIAKIDKFLNDHKDISSDAFDEGEEVRKGLLQNKNIYSYFTIVGTEIPQKLWLTHLDLGKNTTIEGQADNLESVYAFFRSLKDYNPQSNISLQKLGLASSSPKNLEDLDAESILTTLDADFYEFRISNEAEKKKKGSKKNSDSQKSGGSDDGGLPDLEVIE